jgi:hypothetical protein
MSRQQQVTSLLLYLAKHGQHIDSLEVRGTVESPVKLHKLNTILQLTRLHFHQITLQLRKGPFPWQDGLVLIGLPLRQLQLSDCALNGGSLGLERAVSMLTQLEHLSIRKFRRSSSISLAVLTHLRQLSHLELTNVPLLQPGPDIPFLQPLQALTRLVDLYINIDRTDASDFYSLDVGMLSAPHHVTSLVLSTQGADVELEPGVLVEQTQLQRLCLGIGSLRGGAARVAQLLSELQHLQQLTHLDLQCSLRTAADNPPAAAFSALTASSKLQHLNISKCTLSAGIWPHVVPRAGRQLSHLQELDISGIWTSSGDCAAAPDGSRLLCCCPGLRSLGMQSLQSRAEQLAPLQDLSGLHTLSLTTSAEESNQVLQVVTSLTGLRRFSLCVLGESDKLVLLQLTQLKHLTALSYDGYLSGVLTRLEFSSKVGLMPCMACMITD